MKRNVKKIKYILVFLLIDCIFIFQIHAQTKFTDNLNVMVNYHSGFVLPEYTFLNYITQDYVQSIDVCLFKETYGKNIWEKLYNYPDYGISLFYTTLGNDKILGREMALTYFFKTNLISKKQFQFYNRTGIGIGYVNRKFDFNTNYLNVAISSNFNIHFNLRLGINYSISNKIDLNTGISFDHFSNANTSDPNLGLNYLTAFGGLSYRIGRKTERLKLKTEPHIRKNNYEIFASIGGKHTRELSTEYFGTSSVSFEITREYFRAFYLGTGVDFFYDSSIKSQLQSEGKQYKKGNDFQSGIHLSQEFVYNKLSLIIHEGIYFYQVNQKNIYNRAIIRYRLTDHLSMRLSMKSHLNILDYPELGIGVKF